MLQIQHIRFSSAIELSQEGHWSPSHCWVQEKEMFKKLEQLVMKTPHDWATKVRLLLNMEE